MKKHTMITLGLTALLISACSDAPEQTAVPVSESGTAVSESNVDLVATDGDDSQPTTLMEKTKELGQQTWDKTKEVTSHTLETVGETSQELYEATKDKASEVGEAISEKSTEVYESAKETTTDAYEATKETGSSLLQDMTQSQE